MFNKFNESPFCDYFDSHLDEKKFSLSKDHVDLIDLSEPFLATFQFIGTDGSHWRM